MKKHLITLMIAALAQTASAQTCYTLTNIGASPLGTNLTDGSNFLISGTLSGTGPLSGNAFAINTSVFSNTGSTTASLSNDEVTFTNAVGLVSSLTDAAINGLPADSTICDFSYTTCTVLSTESTSAIAELLQKYGSLSYGIEGSSETYAITQKNFDEKTGSYYFDSSFFTDAKSMDRITLTAGRIDYSEYLKGQTTVLKDFTVCVCVPEPSSAALLGLAGLAAVARRKRA